MMSKSGNFEETDSSSDEEDIEPKLKYVRLTSLENKNDLHDILSKDSISCIAVHSKFLCLGTHSGAVYILDYLGHAVTLNGKKSFQTHTALVNQISVDNKGEHIATCSDDGIVIIYGLHSTDSNLKMDMGQKVKAVALDPNLYKSSRKFIAGDKQMTMYERTMFKPLKSTVLSTSYGFVSKIAWNGQWVAWATDLDVRIYDLVAKTTVGLIKWKVPTEEKLDDYRCNLKWSTATTLIIGWVNTIRICSIRKPNAIEASTRNMPNYIVDTTATFRTDFYICGLAPLETNQLVVLGFPKEREPTTNKALKPILSVFQYTVTEYTEICSDCLPLSGYQEYNCNDYHLDCLIDENQYFIVTPKDIIIASQYDRDDRVEWLIDHEMFDEAMEIVGTEGAKYSLLSVERKYIDYLLLNGYHEDAAKLCFRAFGNNKLLWEEEVYKFLKVRQLRSISAYIPRTIDCKLNGHIYELILCEYLQLEPIGFLELIKEWNPALYNTSSIIKATHDYLGANANNHILLEALAILYSYEKNYEKALTVYLKLQHKDVFHLIQKHNLYSAIHSMIVPLIKLDNDKAIQMLLETNKISPGVVVEQLKHIPEYLYLYLDLLKDKSEYSEKYHEELVRLYAKFSPEKLLPLLKRSNNYPIQMALDICTSSLFYPEMVYLLGRMGNTREALAIIINKINNVHMAIEFCKHHDDAELWNVFIDKSIDKPEIMTKILDSIIGYINPEILINKIKIGQEIPELKQSLIKMLCDYKAQLTIEIGCNDVLTTDYFNLHEKLIKNQRKGMCVSNEISCELCRRDIIIKGSLNTSIVAFNCRHVFHETCLPDKFNIDYCTVCNFKKKF